ncbi:hypothetical protein BC941DRAFT_330440, partial [Chlamydoabsidia padenii]
LNPSAKLDQEPNPFEQSFSSVSKTSPISHKWLPCLHLLNPALKCRQRKKQWLNNLQAKVEYLTNDNEQLQIQTNALREEIMNLKTLLLAHKDCP